MIGSTIRYHRLGLAVVFVAMALMLEHAGAGGVKTLPDEFFEDKTDFQLPSKPSNFGDAMEMEFFEFKTKRDEDREFRCRIRQNKTGQPLLIRLLNVDGTSLGHCVALPDSTCSMPYIALKARRKHTCVVSTLGGAPVPPEATYRMGVQRR